MRKNLPKKQKRLLYYSWLVFLSSIVLLPAKALHVSGVLEMSSREPMDSECSADGLLRGGGKGEISVSLVN